MELSAPTRDLDESELGELFERLNAKPDRIIALLTDDEISTPVTNGRQSGPPVQKED